MYSQQHMRLYKTVKFLQLIFNLNQFAIKLRFDWEFSTGLTCVGVDRDRDVDLPNYFPK
jgi:hypothetical protein